MRLKLTLLAACCFLLFACPSSDDDNNETTVALTPTNYVYEGDLYRFSLTSQIELWEAIGPNDPGFDQAQIDIAANNEILMGVQTGVQIGVIPIPIPPPPPPPCLCFDLYNTINFIVAEESTIGLVATLTNENQETIFSSDLSSPIGVEGFQGVLEAFNFNQLQDNYVGKGSLTINRVLADESVLSYSFDVYVHPVQ